MDIKTLSAIIGYVSNSTTLNVCAYGEEECEKLLAEMKLIAQGIPAEEIAGFAEADGNTAVTGPRRPGLSKAMMDASRPGNTAHVDHANVLYQIPVSIR